MEEKDPIYEAVNTAQIESVLPYHHPHDSFAKFGLKNKRRFLGLLKLALTEEQFNKLDTTKIEFLDTEFLKELGFLKSRLLRADIVVKIGIKDSDKSLLVGSLAEHKSHSSSEKDIYMQSHTYQAAMLTRGLYPAIVIYLLHGNAPIIKSPNLQEVFGLSPSIAQVFPGALNFSPIPVDLRSITESQIIELAGAAAPMCLAFKWGKQAEESDIVNIFGLCRKKWRQW